MKTLLCTLCVLFLPLHSEASLFQRLGHGKPDRLSSVSRILTRPFTASLVPFSREDGKRSAGGSVAEWREAVTEAMRLGRYQQHQRMNTVTLNRNYSKFDGAEMKPVTFAATNSTTTKRVEGSCSSSDVLHGLLDDIVCSNSYLKALVTAIRKCNLFAYFDSDHIRGCGVDSNGTYCRKHEREFPDPDYMAWNVLQQCTLQTKSSTCSSSCKSALSNFASKFGCCIHVSRVSWFVEDNPHILVLSSALWTYCGLTRPKPCGNVPSLPEATIAGSCTYGCYAYARSALICEGVGGQLIETYNNCGRKGTALELGQLCGLNHNGMACFELQFSDNTDYLLSVYTDCFKYFSSGVCTETCSRALKRFRKKYGCCVNVYNGTAFGDSSQLLGSIVTSYGLWSRCAVESPGMCSLPSEIETGNKTYRVEAFCDNLLTGGATTTEHLVLMLWLHLLLSAVCVFVL